MIFDMAASLSRFAETRMITAVFDLTLSFDNGPTPDVTPFVLDVLARRGVKSTFFVIGEKLGGRGTARSRSGRMPRATGSAITPGAIRCRSG